MKTLRLASLLTIMFVTSSCTEEVVDNSTVLTGSNSGAIARAIATAYTVNSEDASGGQCHKEPDQHSTALATLANNTTVKLASHRTGMVANKGKYWIHVFPLTHPTIKCYMRTRDLIPVPEY